jgi:predicted RNA-binding Zn-ribbon protein involved in translation (DUF1610 family)
MLVHDLPWWVSVVLAGVVYVLMRSVAPALWQGNPLLGNIMKAMPGCAGLAAMFILCLAGLNLYVRGLKRISQRPRVTDSPDVRSDEKRDTAAVLACPACGGTMVSRTARRGANIGARFWGCSLYPACEGTRSV